MLATPCAQCGKPTPLSLANPDEMTCPSCGHRDRPRPEIAQELMIASSALAELDARHRQLTVRQRAGLGGAPFMLRYGIASAILAAACFALAARISVVPGIVLVAQGVAVVLVIRSRARALEDKLAAISGSAKPGCRVCGAELDVHPNDPISRCHYCAADNLVSPAAMSRAARQRVLANFPAEVATAAALPGR